MGHQCRLRVCAAVLSFKIALNPNRPTPQVSNIAQSILSELDRVRGTKMTLTLDIDAEAPDASCGARRQRSDP